MVLSSDNPGGDGETIIGNVVYDPLFISIDAPVVNVRARFIHIVTWTCTGREHKYHSSAVIQQDTLICSEVTTYIDQIDGRLRAAPIELFNRYTCNKQPSSNQSKENSDIVR